jgi:protein TonB
MSAIRTIVLLIASCTAIAFAQNGAATSPDSTQDQTQPARPRAVHVSTGVMLGLVAHKTMPRYPEDAMKKGIQGNVIFKVEVDEAGMISSSALVEGDPLLVAASKDSLQTFRFRPYLVDGTPTRIQGQLGFHFSAEKTPDGTSGQVECMASIPNRP